MTTIAAEEAAATTRINWNARDFEVLEVGPSVSSGYVPEYVVYGHDSPRCPRLTGPVLARSTSLADLAERNEFWDGEVRYSDPWPCCSCVDVATSGRTVGFEASRPVPTVGAGGFERPAFVPDPRVAGAVAFVRAYQGQMSFLLAMKEKAQRPGWTPTPNMLAAILRCQAVASMPAEAPQAAATTPAAVPGATTPEDARRAALLPNRYAGVCASCKGDVGAEAGRRERVATGWTVLHSTTAECARTEQGGQRTGSVVSPAAAPLPDVPQGHYAVASTGANDLAFYRVDRPEDGPWAGRTFIKRIVGGHPDGAVPRSHISGILRRIAEAGVGAAAVLYGQEIGSCYVCNRHLTDETSRRLGIGPDCRSKRSSLG